jgi:hypothetical protein
MAETSILKMQTTDLSERILAELLHRQKIMRNTQQAQQYTQQQTQE